MAKRKNAVQKISRLDYRYIYILGNTRYLFRYKIGIARNVENRKRGIDSTLNGTTYEIFSVKVFYAQRIEQFLHSVYRPLHARMYGSGHTEWFWMVLPVTPTVLLALIFVCQWIMIPLILVGGAYVLSSWV
jgi:T5orf172 domain